MTPELAAHLRPRVMAIVDRMSPAVRVSVHEFGLPDVAAVMARGVRDAAEIRAACARLHAEREERMLTS